MLRWFIVAVVVTGCRHFPERAPDPDYGTDITDTQPAFYGRVPRNLVMISLDTLRRDHLDRYAETSASPTMPFLSNLARHGVPLDDLVQCSDWTFASTSCTLAGRYNVDAGMAPMLVEAGRTPWPEGTPFLAGYLADAGYYSVLSSTNGWLADEWGNTQGYTEWFHPFDGSALGAYREARVKLDRARARGVADRWFLHVHATEPHAPYDPPLKYLDALQDLPPAPWDLASRDQHYDLRDDYPALSEWDQALLESHLRARYRGDLTWLDDQLFAIYQDLETDGLLDDALLVVWSDHGEAFWEHGWQTHAYTLHGEETDAIALFWAKNIVTDAWTEPTSAIDLAPTVMQLLTGEVPDAMTGDPLGMASADRPRFSWAVARLGAWQSVEREGHKLVFRWTGGLRLYDRTTDPLEQVDLYDPENPSPMARALWADLQPMVEAASALTPGFAVRWPVELIDK